MGVVGIKVTGCVGEARRCTKLVPYKVKSPAKIQTYRKIRT